MLSLTFNAFWKNHGHPRHTYVRAGKISASMVAHLAVGWRPLPTLQLQGGLWDVCNHCVKKVVSCCSKQGWLLCCRAGLAFEWLQHGSNPVYCIAQVQVAASELRVGLDKWQPIDLAHPPTAKVCLFCFQAHVPGGGRRVGCGMCATIV